MGSIRIEGNADELRETMKQVSELDKAGLNAALAEGIRESTLERFKTGRAPDGTPWKPSLRVKSGGGKTLVQTARLRNSIQCAADSTGFAVGSNTVYAATHQLGEKGRVIRARSRKGLRFQIGGKWVIRKQVLYSVAARPYLGFSDEDMRELQGTTEDFVLGGR